MHVLLRTCGHPSGLCTGTEADLGRATRATWYLLHGPGAALTPVRRGCVERRALLLLPAGCLSLGLFYSKPLLLSLSAQPRAGLPGGRE